MSPDFTTHVDEMLENAPIDETVNLIGEWGERRESLINGASEAGMEVREVLYV